MQRSRVASARARWAPGRNDLQGEKPLCQNACDADVLLLGFSVGAGWLGVGSGRSSLDALRSRGVLRGLESVSDSELLALVIGEARGRGGELIARELIDRFGDLAGVGKAAAEEYMSFDGVGRAASLRIKASFELGRRAITMTREREIRTARSPGDVAALMIPEMRELDREHFKAILLNTKNGILRIVTIAVGSLNAALVHPRELFKAAVAASAAGVILVHNHPTGNPEPSTEDRELTGRFARCGDLLGIELVDHIVIGGARWVSMRERGIIGT
jgi:DNA repair protein RadC